MSDSDDDYDYEEDRGLPVNSKRYPLHDCVEFEDVQALKDLIYVQVEESSDDEEEEEGPKPQRQHNDDSSSDENDSTEAAHAAAIGHSPQPIKPTVSSAVSSQLQAAASLGGAPPKQVEADREDTKAPVEEEKEKGDEEKPAAEASPDAKEQATETAKQGEAPQEKPDEGESQKPADDDAMDVDEKPSEQHATNGNGRGKPAEPSPKPKKLVLNHSINLNERDDDENTPLHVAVHARKLEHVKVLLEAGASCRMKSDGSFPIHTAISMGSVRRHRQFAYECVVLFHEHGVRNAGTVDLASKDDSGHTPLFLACMFNQPQIVSYLLSDDVGLSTLNTRADRVGNRPLHAAAKFDTLDNPSVSRAAAASATGQISTHHHPDGTVVHSMHHIPGLPAGKTVPESSGLSPPHPGSAAAAHAPSSEALLTQVLLGTNGIEVDAANATGQTPLHVACFRGNWAVARLLLHAGASPRVTDRRGFTPGQLAYKRAMPIPNDLVDTLGDPPETGVIPPLRDLIVDPDNTTLLLCHELCILHRTCAPITRNSQEPPPENVRRLHVLVDEETGILRSGEFGSLVWKGEARRASIADVLKVHEYTYVEQISSMASRIPDHPSAISHLDPDTAISRWSFEAAMRAAGSICQAVDRVVAGESRNAFCAVRPPGHHAGPRGIVRCANDPEGGSHGFCLLNNVAIGAAYARAMYRHEGIRKVAIIDFDVHHGNGTEAVIRNLVPGIEKGTIRTPFAFGEISTSSYRPWLDETDIQNVFFASTHGYGNRGYEQPGWFYPASGRTHTSEAISHPAMVETPSTADFILSQTWARMGDDSKANCCKIINVGLDLPEPDEDPILRSMKQRIELRDTYRKKILPALREFDPDLIFISAGFDGHKKDTMNFGYVGMVEDDYEWVSEQLVKVANTCCNGRVISVLEGGYKIHGGIVSPFARSVASHVRALADGGRSRELFDPQDCEWESQFEQSLYERRERKKEQEREQLRLMEEANRRRRELERWPTGETPEDPDAPSRKRRRNQVNYKELFKQMQQEGFAG